MKKNGYQEFDERENLKRAKELNMQLIQALGEFNNVPKNNLDLRIEKLEDLLKIYETVKEEAFDFDEAEYNKFREKLKYLRFRRQYLEEFDVDQISVEELNKYAEKKKQEDIENMKKYREETLNRDRDEI